MLGKNSMEDQVSPFKAIIVVIAVLLLVSGIYFVSHHENNQSKKDGQESVAVAKSSGLDKDQKVKNVGDVEEVISKWIESNPEAVIQSIMKMQQKAAETQQANAKTNIASKRDEIYNRQETPTYTPKDYDVAIVEFFDYNCGYCKRAQSTVEQLINQDKKVKVIYKEYPILGPASEELSKVALAVNIIDPLKYNKFHNQLMKSSAHNTSDAIKIAASLGINAGKIKEILETKKDQINAQINANRELAASIGVNGTPGFVIGDELIPGAVDLDVLKDKISKQRNKV